MKKKILDAIIIIEAVILGVLLWLMVMTQRTTRPEFYTTPAPNQPAQHNEPAH